MRRLTIALMIGSLLICCTIKNKNSKIFDGLIGKEDIVIVLSTYGLDSVPKEIGQLQNVKSLTIVKDSSKGWKIYPPLSALTRRVDVPPFTRLPDEILELKTLTTLSLVDLNIKALPDDFNKLENLETLDLTLNKLTISNEITKLNGLKKLKHLALFGNRVDSIDIQELKKENSNLEIESAYE